MGSCRVTRERVTLVLLERRVQRSRRHPLRTNVDTKISLVYRSRFSYHWWLQQLDPLHQHAPGQPQLCPQNRFPESQLGHRVA